MDRTLGRKLKGARVEAGFDSPAEIAALVGRSPRQVGNYESGVVPPADVLVKWARATGKTLEHFFSGDGDGRAAPAVRLLPNAQAVAEFVLLPVLGRVTAGPGGLDDEHIEEYRHLPATFVPPGHDGDCFLVEARGESMADAGGSEIRWRLG